MLADVLAPVLRRDPDALRDQVCVGPAEHCAELLSRYAEAGCRRVYLWPLGDEARQLERVAEAAAPYLSRQLGEQRRAGGRPAPRAARSASSTASASARR